jgi:uncharacterized protein YfaS (alpha-2-macroglobulin family)
LTVGGAERPLAVVLKITEPHRSWPCDRGRPSAGSFEIDNPRLVSSGETARRLDPNAVEPANAEFRDDACAAFVARGDGPVFTVVTWCGRSARPPHPQAYVEDMYRPDRFGRTGTGTVEVTTAR